MDDPAKDAAAADALECMMSHCDVTLSKKGPRTLVGLNLELGGGNARESCNFEFSVAYSSENYHLAVERAHDMMHRLMDTVREAHPVGGEDVPRKADEMH